MVMTCRDYVGVEGTEKAETPARLPRVFTTLFTAAVLSAASPCTNHRQIDPTCQHNWGGMSVTSMVVGALKSCERVAGGAQVGL
jgi:hypothetical protein